MNAHRPSSRRNARQRLSAGAVIVRRTENGMLFLLLRAFKHWDFPKGMVEAGETPLEGAIREIEEETGIEELAFPWGEDFYETPPYNRGKVARYYLAETKTESVELKPNPQTGRTEHVEYDWVSFEQAWHLVSPRVQKALEWVARRLDLDSEGQPRQ